MATSKKGAQDILSVLRGLGMEDAEIRASRNADAIAALDAEKEALVASAAEEIAKLEEQALPVLKGLKVILGLADDEPTPSVRAELLGLTLTDFRRHAPTVSAILDLTTPKTGTASRGSGDGARAEMAWSVLAGLAPKWLALNGKGKDGRIGKSGAVYYFAPPLTTDANGETVWRTKVLHSETRSMSVAFSQRGNLRPTMAAIAATMDAFGKLEEFAKATSTADKPVSVDDLLAIAEGANVGWVDLGDLGDPTTMSNEQLEKAFANREGLTYTRLVASK